MGTQRHGDPGMQGCTADRDAGTWRCRGDRAAGIQSWSCRDREMWGCRADAGIQDTEMQGCRAGGDIRAGRDPGMQRHGGAEVTGMQGSKAGAAGTQGWKGPRVAGT